MTIGFIALFGAFCLILAHYYEVQATKKQQRRKYTLSPLIWNEGFMM
jgi:hypothetical protein